MNNAQDMSPDFVLMRLVSAAEYDRLDEDNLMSAGGVVSGFSKAVLGHHGNNINNGFEFDPNNPTAGPTHQGNPSPHYSSQLESRLEALDSGVMLTRPPAPDAPPPPDFAVAQRFDFPHGVGRGSRAQLMVFQNLLRSSDGILECGLDPPGFQVSDAEKQEASPACITTPAATTTGEHITNCSADLQHHRLQWHPMLKLSQVVADELPSVTEGGGLCHRHQLVPDTIDWPPILDKTLHFSLLDPRRACPPGGEGDPVLTLARRLGELGQASDLLLREGGEGPRCSCHSLLASSMVHGEDPSEASDALLVLEGLGAEEMGSEGFKGGASSGEEGVEGGGGQGAAAGGAFSSSSLSGLMRQVQRLTGEACCDPQVCHPPLDTPGPSSPGTPRLRSDPPAAGTQSASPSLADLQLAPDPPSAPPHTPQSQPQSRATTPKLGVLRAPSPLVVEGAARCSGGGEGEKTPRGKSRKGGSLKFRLSKLFRTKSSSGSSHLLDKRPSLASSTSSGGSLVDVWGSSCSSTDQDAGSRLLLSRPQSAFSPVPFSPAFTDTFLRGLPRPVPLPGAGPPSSRLHQRPTLCPLSRPDASSFTTSLRELEKCGWYWGPMNWEDAEMKLKARPDGSFLVRDSSDPRYILSLSFRSQGVTHHTRMEHYRGTFSLWCHPKFEDRCHSVVEFIERAIMHSKNGKFLYFLRSRVPGLPPTPVQLLYPVSRFSSVKSLQHLCRFCIRQQIRIDHIQELPLPRPLIIYLRKFYYYDPEEEMYLSIKDTGRGHTTQEGVESQT
ncbi:suppressor of cytokine signaling 7-like isoform X5 [Hypomesus transpacificus]|uniref:suppressor of cytokine signaling 7-like isoform X5 n=1 Tax=Hypomesus transpacificus TaxID=137520 RepID=UPI001F086EC7|nr:suppressor of cytokine signaling 7-like isoform X5 [Hypomesus transpacificus]